MSLNLNISQIFLVQLLVCSFFASNAKAQFQIMPIGEVGYPYSFSITCLYADLCNSLIVSGLAPGLSMSSNGQIHGFPTTVGIFSFTAAPMGGSVEATGTITVVKNPLSVPAKQLSLLGVNVPYLTEINARGGLPPIQWTISEGTLPPGLKLDPSSTQANVSGTPTVSGIYRATFQARDTEGTIASQQFSFAVGRIVVPTLPPATIGTPYSAQFTAENGTGKFDIGTGTVPPGLILFPGGLLSGTPTQTGTFSFTVVSGVLAAQVTIVVEVARPVIQTSVLAYVTVGQGYSQSIAANGGAPPYKFSATGLPPGIVISLDGALSGTPTAGGDYDVTINVQDSAGATGSRHLLLRVFLLTFTTASTLPPATLGVPYSGTVIANGGLSPYAFVLVSTAPPGLTLNGSGQFSGTPTAAGTYTLTIRVSDTFSETATKDFQLMVQATPTLTALAHIAARDTWTTGIMAVNTAVQSATFDVAFYDDFGTALQLPFDSGMPSHLSATLPALGSAYYEASDPLHSLLSGWGQIKADPGIVIQALFRENSNGRYYEAAVPSRAASKEFEIPFDASTFAATGEPFFTGFAAENLHASTPSTLTCTARDVTGGTIANAFDGSTGPPQLSPLGHWAGYSFPALTGRRGTIDCVSNTNVVATALRFIGNNAFSSLSVIDKSRPAAGPTALPHFAAQDAWTTGVFAVNTGNASAKYSVAFYDDAGNPVSLPFSGGATNTLTGTLPALGSAYAETSTAPGAALIAGWGKITADDSIAIQAIFRENASGTYYEAAVPASVASQEFEIPFDATVFSAAGVPFYTGFAIANLDATSPAKLTCTARDSQGVVIPDAFNAVTGPPQLAPLGHWAGYLFPALAGKRGTIDCMSTTAIAATALRFIGTNAFSSLSVITK